MGLFSFAKKKQPKISTVTTEKKKTFGIAFAGGGGRGYAHIGALKALEENNIPRANVVSGTSVGSIIGSAYALGYRADEIYEYAKEVSIESFSYRGLLGVDKLSKLLDKDVRSRFFNITRDSETIEKIMTNFYGKKAFCNTLSEFYTNAVDLYTGKEVILDSGSIAKACRASSSVPGVFTPTKIGDMLLVDGGVLNNMPADIIRDKCDVLMGLDLYHDAYTPAKNDNTFEVLTSTVEILIGNARIKNHPICDILVEPELDKFGAVQFDDDSKKRFYEEGYNAMNEMMPALKELLKPELIITEVKK
ncbi:MAG: patatin-like phospholipase family protein [Eubacteriaceae bacterium]|nr:patatin-like phospholipase family protein [Eubacteriaceae bacterium]